MTQTITIVCRDTPAPGKSGDFDVFVGEQFHSRLCWEEMLGQIATLTHKDIPAPRFMMHDVDSFLAEKARWRRSADDTGFEEPR